jgi:hypothetical protein
MDSASVALLRSDISGFRNDVAGIRQDIGILEAKAESLETWRVRCRRTRSSRSFSARWMNWSRA